MPNIEREPSRLGFAPKVQGQRAVVLDVADGAAVNEVINRPQVLTRLIDQALNLVRLGHIALAEECASPKSPDGSGGLLCVTDSACEAEGDVCAFACQANRGRTSDAPRPASNEDDSIGEIGLHGKQLLLQQGVCREQTTV